MSAAVARLRALCSPTIEWCDPDTGEVVEVDRVSLRDRWYLFGPHSYEWRWVRRRGGLGCGCTRNPLTRRMVLMRMDCAAHGLGSDFAVLPE